MCIERKHGGCHVPKSHGRPEAPGCVRFGLVLRAYFSEVLRYVTMLSDGFVRQGQARCTDATSPRQFIGIFRVPASWESTGSHGQRRHACLAILGSKPGLCGRSSSSLVCFSFPPLVPRQGQCCSFWGFRVPAAGNRIACLSVRSTQVLLRAPLQSNVDEPKWRPVLTEPRMVALCV